MTNLSEHRVATGRGDIVYYRSELFPNRPTVLFLHGLSSNHTTWIEMMEAMRVQKINCIAPDLRGHGNSDKAKKMALYTWDIFTSDMLTVMDDAKVEKATIVGYSYGGPLAMHIALRAPERVQGLVLISTNHKSTFSYNRWLFWFPPVGSAIFRFLGVILIWQYRKKYSYYIHSEAGGYWDATWRGLTTMPLSVDAWMLRQMGHLNLGDRIKNITAPALLIHSPGDPFLPDREVADMIKLMPHARDVLPKHKSHFIASQAQEELAETISEFVLKEIKQ